MAVEPRRQTIREDDVGGRTGAAPLASLAQNPYKFSSHNYPIDIENLSHAMLFNINVDETSSDFRGDAQNPAREQRDTRVTESRRDRLLGNTPKLTKRFRRIKRAISLYMPDTIVFDSRQNYEAPSLLEKLGISGTAIATNATALVENSNILEDPLSRYLAGAAGGALGSGAISTLLGGTAGSLGAAIRGLNRIDRGVVTPTLRTAAQLAGYALNPVIEVLYSSPLLRAFSFDFVFAPRSKKEADEVWKIIFEFRRHSMPEFAKTGLGIDGYIMLPPSQFEITFLRKGSSKDPNASGGFVENTNIPRITTCVLTDVQVDYSPLGGFVSFEDGMPIQISMRLVFLETNMITREMVDRGY